MAFRVLNLSAVAAQMGRCMSTSSSTVGFIGLGQMGNRMATNLINKVMNYYLLLDTTTNFIVNKT